MRDVDRHDGQEPRDNDGDSGETGVRPPKPGGGMPADELPPGSTRSRRENKQVARDNQSRHEGDAIDSGNQPDDEAGPAGGDPNPIGGEDQRHSKAGLVGAGGGPPTRGNSGATHPHEGNSAIGSGSHPYHASKAANSASQPHNPSNSRSQPRNPSNPANSRSQPHNPSNPANSRSQPHNPSNPANSRSQPRNPSNPADSGSQPRDLSNPAGSGSQPSNPSNPAGSGSQPSNPSNPAGSGGQPSNASNPVGSARQLRNPSNPADSESQPHNASTPAGSGSQPYDAGEPAASGVRGEDGGWFPGDRKQGRRAFMGAFLGYGLDSYDFWVLPLGLAAIASALGLSSGQTGLLSTTTLVFSALGGVLGGVLADRIGRVRTLMYTVATYALFTALCGIAWDYESLLVFRAAQGLGFGAEWATGAVLVAEYTASRYRGRAVAWVQSAWAVGWAAAVVVYLVVFSVFPAEVAWRALFVTGALPALLVVYLRRGVRDAAVYRENREAARGSLRAIFRRDLVGTTAAASLLATGCQGGYYTLATWLPSYLTKERGLTVMGTTGYLLVVVLGAFAGYLTGGQVADRLGRKQSFRLFAVLSAALMLVYARLPEDAGGYVVLLGLPLGFCSSAIFSGFGAYLAELYPSRARGAGPGFTYNFGRAVGAFFPGVIGFLAVRYGIGGAMSFGALAYALAFVSLFWLPETRGRALA